MAEYAYRLAAEADLPVILSIEESVYPVPWTFNFFRIIFHMNTDKFYVALDGDAVIGYTVGEIEKMGKVNAPRLAGHILNIAVSEEYQGKGVGTMLLDVVEKRFIECGADIAYLEVRESNVNAQRVYRNRGYQYVRPAAR